MSTINASIVASTPALGPTQPPIQWVSGALFLGVKRPGREADHSTPSSADVKNAWSYTSTPQYAFMALCSVKKSTGTTSPLTLPLPLVCIRAEVSYGQMDLSIAVTVNLFMFRFNFYANYKL
jgi:hypothetical protein